jgi:hypothetical protein
VGRRYPQRLSCWRPLAMGFRCSPAVRRARQAHRPYRLAQGDSRADARLYARFVVISKFAEAIGLGSSISTTSPASSASSNTNDFDPANQIVEGGEGSSARESRSACWGRLRPSPLMPRH